MLFFSKNSILASLVTKAKNKMLSQTYLEFMLYGIEVEVERKTDCLLGHLKFSCL